MGIKNLTKLLKLKAPNSIREISFKELKGKKIAIDASFIIYQSVTAIRSNGFDLMNKDGNITSHIHGIFYKNIKLLMYGITPIYVFDGTSPDLKANTLAKRKQIKEDAQEKFDENNFDEDNIGEFKKAFHLTKDIIDSTIQLLKYMGISYMMAEGEADLLCVQLAINGTVKGVCTDDGDMLTFGAPFLFKGMLKALSKDGKFMEINLQQILISLEITLQQFVILCMLLGCDYCIPIKGIGMKRSLEMIKDIHSLKNLFKFLDSRELEYDKDCYKQTYKYFTTKLSSVPEIKKNNFDVDGLVKFMVDENSFNKDKLKTGIDKLKKINNIDEDSGENIMKYFK